MTSRQLSVVMGLTFGTFRKKVSALGVHGRRMIASARRVCGNRAEGERRTD
jgi:hypothetical protein